MHISCCVNEVLTLSLIAQLVPPFNVCEDGLEKLVNGNMNNSRLLRCAAVSDEAVRKRGSRINHKSVPASGNARGSSRSKQPSTHRRRQNKSATGHMKLKPNVSDRSDCKHGGSKQSCAAIGLKPFMPSHGKSFISKSLRAPMTDLSTPSIETTNQCRYLPQTFQSIAANIVGATCESTTPRFSRNWIVLDWLQKYHQEFKKMKSAENTRNQSLAIRRIPCTTPNGENDGCVVELVRDMDTFSGAGEHCDVTGMDPHYFKGIKCVQMESKPSINTVNEEVNTVQEAPFISTQTGYLQDKFIFSYDAFRVPEINWNGTDGVVTHPTTHEAVTCTQSQAHRAVDKIVTSVYNADVAYVSSKEGEAITLTHKQWLRHRFLKARALEQTRWDVCHNVSTRESSSLSNESEQKRRQHVDAANSFETTLQDDLKQAITNSGAVPESLRRSQTTSSQTSRGHRGKLLFKFPAITLVPENPGSVQQLDDAGDKQRPNVTIHVLHPAYGLTSENLLVDTVVQKPSDWTETKIAMLTK